LYYLVLHCIKSFPRLLNTTRQRQGLRFVPKSAGPLYVPPAADFTMASVPNVKGLLELLSQVLATTISNAWMTPSQSIPAAASLAPAVDDAALVSEGSNAPAMIGGGFVEVISEPSAVVNNKPSETKIVEMKDVAGVSSPSSSRSCNALLSNRTLAIETNRASTRKNKTESKVLSTIKRKKVRRTIYNSVSLLY